MKGVFGILLVGGGIILLVGLFRGSIPFPLNFPQPGSGTGTPSTGPVGSPASPNPTVNSQGGVTYQGSTGTRSYS